MLVPVLIEYLCRRTPAFPCSWGTARSVAAVFGNPDSWWPLTWWASRWPRTGWIRDPGGASRSSWMIWTSHRSYSLQTPVREGGEKKSRKSFRTSSCPRVKTHQRGGRNQSSCLSKRFRAGVEFAPVDVKFSSFVPEPPGVQQVAVVLDPALYTRVLHYFSTRALNMPHKKKKKIPLSQHHESRNLKKIHHLGTFSSQDFYYSLACSKSDTCVCVKACVWELVLPWACRNWQSARLLCDPRSSPSDPRRPLSALSAECPPDSPPPSSHWSAYQCTGTTETKQSKSTNTNKIK